MQRLYFEDLCNFARDGGSLEKIQSLINLGVDLNGKDRHRRTPLLLAAQWAHRDIVELLIEHGADIHCCNDHQFTVLHYAAMKGWSELVQYFVDNGVDINSRDCYGMTPLLAAADWGTVEIVDLLIRCGAEINSRDDNDKWTVLHYAAMKGWDATTVRFLVKEGADYHARDRNGDTPLHHAVRRKRWSRNRNEIVRELLEFGANCNVKNKMGGSPITILLSMNDISGVRQSVEMGGAYFQSLGYDKLLQMPFVKNVVLRDSKLCSQAIVNEFNKKHLPALYRGMAAVRLPCIDKLKLARGSGGELEIEKGVVYEIETKGFCNVLEACPIVLSILCVKALVKYYPTVDDEC